MMRRTSSRRRATRATIYRGAPGRPVTRMTGPRAVPANEPGVDCPACDTRVRSTPDGRAVAHAPGGFGTSVKAGRFRCPAEAMAVAA